MSNIDCKLLNSNYNNLIKGISLWAEKDSSKEIFTDPYEAVFRLVEADFLMPLDNLKYADNLTKGQVSSFLSRLEEYKSNVKSGELDSKFAQIFWQSSHYGKKDPSIGKFLNDSQQSSFYFRANQVRDKRLVSKITRELEKEALMRGASSKIGIKLARRKLRNLDDKLLKATADVKNGVEGAEKKYNDIKKETNEFLKNSSLAVFDDALNIIEKQIPLAIQDKFNDLNKKAYDRNGNVINKKLAKKVEEYRNGDKVLKLTDSEISKYLKMTDGRSIIESDHMYNAILGYTQLMDGMYKTLRNGVDARIESVIKRLEVNGQKKSAKDVKDLRKKLKGMYMPKYEQGFFPHYTRDLNAEFLTGLMRPFDDMQRSVNPYDVKGKDIKTIINSMKLHISEHTKLRQQNMKERDKGFVYDYSRNFFNAIDNYVFDVNRFNYTAYMDSHLINALGSIEKIYKKNSSTKGYAQNIADYLIDMHRAANGDNDIDSVSNSVMRTFLSFEFASKLGLNPRGAARNAFQRLLDYVEWGPVQIMKSKRYLREIPFKEGNAENYIDSVLNKVGLLFEEGSQEFVESQLATKASKSKRIEYNERTGKYEAITKGGFEKVAEGMGTFASKLSWLHRKAENANRKHTFKIAYAQMHQWLSSPKFVAKLKNDGKSTPEIENIIKRHSENYAINGVVMNHFDYADYAKSPLMRSKVGKFVFQFQHYSMEFAERNIKILRETKHDISSGEFNPHLLSDTPGGAQGLAKSIRMGLLYFGAPLFGSMAFGVDFDNLIEHDLVERIKRWSAVLTGDKEDIEKAFYGKGPVLGSLGFPALSTIIDIGMLLELQNAQGEEYLTLLTGIEKYDPSNSSTDISRKIRILNTFAGRFVERHIPQLIQGRVGWAAQQEFALYPTAKSKKIQKEYFDIRKKTVPKSIEDSLRQLEGREPKYA